MISSCLTGPAADDVMTQPDFPEEFVLFMQSIDRNADMQRWFLQLRALSEGERNQELEGMAASMAENNENPAYADVLRALIDSRVFYAMCQSLHKVYGIGE